MAFELVRPLVGTETSGASSARVWPFYLAVGTPTGRFGLLVGALFTLGIDNRLPDLPEVFGIPGEERLEAGSRLTTGSVCSVAPH